jgi:hypothetical protein
MCNGFFGKAGLGKNIQVFNSIIRTRGDLCEVPPCTDVHVYRIKKPTMIADVLHDARLEMAYYLDQYPHVYEEVREEVQAVCAVMQALQTKLENPFTDEELAAMRAAQEGGDAH